MPSAFRILSERLYDLRHTHAGVHPKVVIERMDHSNIVITLNTYSHVIHSLQRESADKLDAVLFAPFQEHDTAPLN
jgi:integrase